MTTIVNLKVAKKLNIIVLTTRKKFFVVLVTVNTYWSDYFILRANVESCCTPEASIIYVNYTSVKKVNK